MTCLCSVCKDMMASPGHELCADCLDAAVEVFVCADPEAAYIQMMSDESAPASVGAVFAFPDMQTRGESTARFLPSGPDGSLPVCMFGTPWCSPRRQCADCAEFATFGGEAA